MQLFFHRLFQLSNISLSPKLLRSDGVGNFRELECLEILEEDIKTVSTKIKKLDMLSIAEGKLTLLLEKETSDQKNQSERLLNLACKHFESGTLFLLPFSDDVSNCS